MLMSSLLILLLVSILSNSSALRLNRMRSTRLIQSSSHKDLISQSRLSMFSNGNDGSSQKIVDEKKETTAETTAVESKEGKNALVDVGFRLQDFLTYGITAWTIYLLGDSIRILMFPPPPV